MNRIAYVLSWVKNLSSSKAEPRRQGHLHSSRFLRLESLESRELLSVTPLGDYGYSSPHEHCGEEHCGESDAPYYCAMPSAELGTSSETPSETPQEAGTAESGSMFQQLPVDLSQTFQLHSNPDAKLKIYLDFDGHITTNSMWNNSTYNGKRTGSEITSPAFNFEGDANSFTDNELTRIQYIWQRIAEDYIPFDVDVTTEDPGLEGLRKTSSTDTEYGLRCVIGGSSSDWYGNAGGVSYVGIFGSTSAAYYNSPCFVFPAQLGNGNEKYVSSAATHEIGHYFGLSHDGESPGDGAYYNGANGWAPIMGTGYYQPLVQWSKGEYANATQKQDDLAILAGELGYRADDYGNTLADAAVLSTENSTLDVAGIIERNTDVDFFQFALDTTQVFDLDIKSGDREPNLDILAKLYDSTGSVIATSNSIDTLNASFSLSLEAGTYYVSIDGTGKVLANGTVIYTDYGSLGTYSLFANIVTLPNTNAEPPTAPQAFKFTERTTNSVTLTWTAQSNLTGYELSYRKTGTTNWTTNTLSASATSATVNNLSDNTAYEFRLTAKNADGEASSTVSASTLRIPTPPTAPQAFKFTERTTNSVTLTWTAQSNLTGYELSYRKTGTSDWTTNALSSGATSATVNNLSDNTAYEFRLTAKNADGEASSTVSASTLRIPTPPTAPQGFKFTERTTNSVTLTWTAQSNLTGYELSYRKTGASDWMTNTLSASATSATVNNLSDNTAYEFRLTAKNADGEASSTVSASTLRIPTPPTAPQGFKFTNRTTDSVTLSWTAQSNLTGYELSYRKTGTTNWTTNTLSASATSATVNDLSDNTAYEFRLTAKNADGEVFSTVSASTLRIPTPPTAPQGFKYTERTTDSVTLSWTAQSNLTGYELSYRKTGTTNWTTNTLSAGATSTTVNNLSDNTAYEFRLTAKNADGEASSTVSASTLRIPTPPTAPQGFKFTERTTDSVTLSWTAQSNLTGYELSYRKTGTTNWTTNTLSASATSATVNTLSDNTAYEFRLTAKNADGEVSSTVSASTLRIPTPPTAPQGFKFTERTTDSVTLSWTAQSNLTGYELSYRKTSTTNWTTNTLSASATSATVNALSDNTAYEFRLTAKNTDGEASSTVSASTLRIPTPPTAPQAFKFTNRTTNSVTLSWTAQSNLTGYELSYRKSGTTNWTTNVLSSGVTSATVNALSDNTAYEFRLTAKNADGEASSTVSANTLRIPTPPTTPQAFKFTNRTTNSVTLSWTAQSNLTGYELSYRKTGTTNWTTNTLSASATLAIVNALSDNTAYEFRLTAKNADGEASSMVSASTLRIPTPPTAPQGFKFTERTTDSVTLSWTAQSNLTGYELSYRKSGTTNWTTNTLSASATSATVNNLSDNTAYEFRLTAKNADGEASSTVSVSTLRIPTPPTKPQNFKTVDHTVDSLTLTWSEQSNLTGYNLSYIGGGKAGVTSINLAPDRTSLTLTGLKGRAVFRFTLTAINADGEAGTSINVKFVGDGRPGPILFLPR